jgi:cobalt-zinc-cadmium efflux system membrane fusion protein
VLAVVQSNLSAAPYEITALIDGMVVEKHVTLGEFVRDDADIFVVADLSTVWVNISVYARFLPQVKVGQRARLTAAGLDDEAEGRIDYVGPIIGESTRTGVARMVLDNARGAWQPGLFVTAHVAVDEARVDVAVPEDAIQSLEGRDAVFVRDGDAFEIRAVELGRRGAGWIEVTSGLARGEEFVAAGSFIFKAEFGKSEAGHDH